VKRFAFRLERLRELRERAQRERAAVLGAAMREEQARQVALEHARLELERAGTQAALLPATGPVTAGLLQNLERARDAAEGRVDEATESLRGANELVSEERERYGLARRDLRVVENLRGKRFDAWREQGAREERKENDEAAQHRRTTKEDLS
jgi:flagellar export protein FliJ